MRVIIAGSRDIPFDHAIFWIGKAIEESGFMPTEVLSGTARGVDYAGEVWAHRRSIPVRRFPPDFKGYGKVLAGRARNLKMAESADGLIAIWNGVSTGTEHMIETAKRCKLKVFVLDTTEQAVKPRPHGYPTNP
jgi:hypothetical protein